MRDKCVPIGLIHETQPARHRLYAIGTFTANVIPEELINV